LRRKASVQLTVSLSDATGAVVFERDVTAHEVEGSMFAADTGIFGSVEKLRELAQQALREVVDQALDDPALRAMIVARGP
jgi:hypothetical protein